MIEAAGGVVWRRGGSGGAGEHADAGTDAHAHGIEVLLVHRPRYDDWSLPKGKLNPGESPHDAALREVDEETGYECELGAPLPETRYIDRKGQPKRVRYWAMTVIRGEFVPNREVDVIEWLTTEDARQRVTYDFDGDVIAALPSVL